MCARWPSEVLSPKMSRSAAPATKSPTRTSPNTAPATQNECHHWSASHMKRHFQCAEQVKSPSNLTKYCACHEILKLKIWAETPWRASANRKTIRGYPTISEHNPNTKSSSRTRRFGDLTRPILETILYCKIQHFALRLSPKMSRSAAPATKSHPPTSPNTAPATQNECHHWCASQLRKSFPMRGASKVTLQHQQCRLCYFTELVLCGPVSLSIYYFADLLLYRSVTLVMCYFTELVLCGTVSLPIYYFADLLLYRSVTLVMCYFTELVLCGTVSLPINYFADLLLYRSVTLVMCYFTELVLCGTVSLPIYYFADLLLYWSVTLVMCYFTELVLCGTVSLPIYYFADLLLYGTITLRNCYFTELLLYWSVSLSILKVRNSEVSHPNFLW